MYTIKPPFFSDYNLSNLEEFVEMCGVGDKKGYMEEYQKIRNKFPKEANKQIGIQWNVKFT